MKTITDKTRIKWLEKMFVEVRLPLVHGSQRVFISSPPEDDSEPSDIRKQIDKFINQRPR